MKSFPTDYLGFVVVNRKFNSPMLPWVVPQIKKKTICNKVNLVVAGGNIAACEACKDQPLFEHSLKSTLKPQLVPANLQDAKGALFLYVLKGDDGRYHCHLFRATDTETPIIDHRPP